MWSLLAVKLSCLAALGLLPLLCGLLPAALRRRSRPPGCAGQEEEAPGAWRGVASCAAGGVFLATCLLDVVPESLADLRDELRRQRLAVEFPLAELVVALGFLLVLVTEHVVVECSQPPPGPDEATLLLPPPGLEAEQQLQQRRPPSGFRALVLTLALSLHAVFEGLAVGLQDSPSRVLHLAAAIVLHKSVVAASLGLLLLQSRLPLRWLAAALATFALMSPLGAGLGMAVTHASGPGRTAARSMLQGLAAGTFMYITFLEILPQELSSPASRLPKVLALLLGFAAMAGLRLLA
ncbi:zinc transporter ZIP1-like [Heteronotia binoei]|uniref:zinc transporter ZIP1-like n=1 Tax=Heteronotia binoei TaxID=13085 RepID=UPI00293027F6|nr:zinc transporter ZIP1-like [Heteronotia binoei]